MLVSKTDTHTRKKIEKNTHSLAKEGFLHPPASMKEHQYVGHSYLSPHLQDTLPG